MNRPNRPSPIVVNHTDSFQLQSLSPLVSPIVRVHTPRAPVRQNIPIRHLNSLPVELPDIAEAPQPFNETERNLITKLAELFVGEQSPKPGKIFIRVNSLSNQLLQKGQLCRINKLEICRYDQNQIKQAKQQMNWEEGNCSLFSFKGLSGQVTGIVVNKGSPTRTSPVAQAQHFLESQMMKSKIIDSDHFTITRKVNIVYKPNNNRPQRPSFYRSTSPNSSITTPVTTQGMENVKSQINKTQMGLTATQNLTKLTALDTFAKQNQLKNKDFQQKSRLLANLEKQYKQMQTKKIEQVSKLEEQIKFYKCQLKSREKILKDLTQKFSQLNNKLTLETKKLNQQKKSKEMYQKGNEKLIAEVKQLKICLKQMRQEISLKDSFLQEAKLKHEQIIQSKNIGSNKNLSETDIQKISSSIFKLVTEKNQNSQSSPINTLQGLFPVLLSPPARQQSNEQSKRVSRVSVANNMQQSKSNPNLLSRLGQFKNNDKMFTNSAERSQNSSRARSFLSAEPRKSALKSIGYVRSSKNDSSGVLHDYMADQECIETPKIRESRQFLMEHDQWSQIIQRIQK